MPHLLPKQHWWEIKPATMQNKVMYIYHWCTLTLDIYHLHFQNVYFFHFFNYQMGDHQPMGSVWNTEVKPTRKMIAQGFHTRVLKDPEIYTSTKSWNTGKQFIRCKAQQQCKCIQVS